MTNPAYHALLVLFNASLVTALIVDWKAPYWNDSSVRLANDTGVCQPGMYRPVPRGHEVHTSLSDWTMLPESVECKEPLEGACQYLPVDAGGAHVCNTTASTPPQWVVCECEPCDCAGEGKGGFNCSQCTGDEGCGKGRKCTKQGMLTSALSKRFTCRFHSDFLRGNYRILFGDGMANVVLLVSWDPFAGHLTATVLLSMCTLAQPILFDLNCAGCIIEQDKINSATGAWSGVCSAKGVYSPCARCSSCQARYPEVGFLGDTTKMLLGVISNGATMACSNTDDKDTSCTFTVDDLPIELLMTCQVGECANASSIALDVAGAVETESRFNDFAVRAIVVLCVVVVLQLLLAAALLLEHLRLKRVAACTEVAGVPPDSLELETGLQVCWEDICYSLGGYRILSEQCGTATTLPGEAYPLAVLGPSGCGKSTLLDILTGRRAPSSGIITVNGKRLENHQLCQYVGYVPQDDMLCASMTVRETLEFSTSMRLPGMSAAQRAERVCWALHKLGISRVAENRVGNVSRRGISGGERRRLAIGFELVIAPPVLVLDEPTRGLDSFSALSLVEVLVDVASLGRVIVCTLHQPRPELLKLFPAKLELVPSDAVLGTGRVSDFLGKASGGVKNNMVRDAVDEEPEAQLVHRSSNLKNGVERQENVERVDENGAMFHELRDSRAQSECDDKQPHAQLDSLHHPSVIKVPASGSITCGVLPPHIATTLWPLQVLTLWRHGLVPSMRVMRGIAGSFIMTGIIAFLSYVIFKGEFTSDISGVQNRMGSFFFVILYTAFSSLSIVQQWNENRARFEHQRTGCNFHASAYFVAKAAEYVFWNSIVLPCLYTLIFFPDVGYQTDKLERVFLYVIVLGSVAAFASGFAVLAAASFQGSSSGLYFSAVAFTVFMVFAGFLRPKDGIPVSLRWLCFLSPFHHAWAAMTINEVEGILTEIEDGGGAALQLGGQVWLAQWSLYPEDKFHHARIVPLEALIIWVLAFVAVYFRFYQPGSFMRRVFTSLFLYMRLSTPHAELPPDHSNSDDPASFENEASLADVHSPEPPATVDELVWWELTFQTRSGQVILNNVTGSVCGQKPLAVLGPSGSGKTSLLDLLSGYNWGSQCASGSVLLDRRKINPYIHRKLVGYVRQDDTLIPSMTPREAFVFAATLRLPSFSTVERATRVEWVLRHLGLLRVANSRIGSISRRGISGGERQRVHVGLELIAAPPVLVVDEATSGLDTPMAVGLAQMIVGLARAGRPVVCTLHQPPEELLKLFSEVMLLTHGGIVAYQGSTNDLISLLNSSGITLIKGVAVADALLDMCQDGRAERLRASFHSSENGQAVEAHAEQAFRESVLQASSSVTPESMSLSVQFRTLFYRDLRHVLRERALAPMHYGSAALIAVLLGATYMSLPRNNDGAFSRAGLFFSVECCFACQAILGLTAWRDGYVNFTRERAQGYFSTGPFVVAKILVDCLLLRVGPTIVLWAILYPMVGLRAGGAAVCLIILCLGSTGSAAFCQMTGALFPVSMLTLPMTVMFLLIFALFGGATVNTSDLGFLGQVFKILSFYRPIYVALISNEFRGTSFEFDPVGYEDVDLEPLTGEQWMFYLGVEMEPPAGFFVGVAVAWSFFYILVALLAQVHWYPAPELKYSSLRRDTPEPEVVGKQ